MTRKLASAAGMLAVLLAVITAIHGLDGGHWTPPLNSLLMSAMNLAAVWFIADRIVESAMKRHGAHESLDNEQMALLIKQHVAEHISAAIDEFGAGCYRAGMVTGAARDSRPHLIRSREGD